MLRKVVTPSSAERTSSTTAPAAGSTVHVAHAQHPVDAMIYMDSVYDQGAKLVLGLGAEGKAQAVRGLIPSGQRPGHQLLPAPGLSREAG